MLVVVIRPSTTKPGVPEATALLIYLQTLTPSLIRMSIPMRVRTATLTAMLLSTAFLPSRQNVTPPVFAQAYPSADASNGSDSIYFHDRRSLGVARHHVTVLQVLLARPVLELFS